KGTVEGKPMQQQFVAHQGDVQLEVTLPDVEAAARRGDLRQEELARLFFRARHGSRALAPILEAGSELQRAGRQARQLAGEVGGGNLLACPAAEQAVDPAEVDGCGAR